MIPIEDVRSSPILATLKKLCEQAHWSAPADGLVPDESLVKAFDKVSRFISLGKLRSRSASN